MSPDFRDSAWLKRERQLIARARKGDREAMGALDRSFAPVLYRQVILPRVGDEAAAEDVLAETFIAAFSSLDKFEQRGLSLFFWLSRMAANKAVDMHRRAARKQRALASFERLVDPEGVANGERDEVLIRNLDAPALRQRVGAVLERINPRYKRAIELRFLEGRERARCAAMLEVKLGTFDVLLLRALRAFRKEWEDER